MNKYFKASACSQMEWESLQVFFASRWNSSFSWFSIAITWRVLHSFGGGGGQGGVQLLCCLLETVPAEESSDWSLAALTSSLFRPQDLQVATRVTTTSRDGTKWRRWWRSESIQWCGTCMCTCMLHLYTHTDRKRAGCLLSFSHSAWLNSHWRKEL